MKTIARETLELLRKAYPQGASVVLDRMEDIQAPPVGTKGTVMFVDSMGTIHVAWETGSTLGVVYGEDKCHKEEM